MDPTAIATLALALFQQVLAFIGSIKAQGGLSDDQILAAAQQTTAGNEAAYAQLKAALVAAGAVAPTS
jgi:hypothetical protein